VNSERLKWATSGNKRKDTEMAVEDRLPTSVVRCNMQIVLQME
jgi:hypothetical protein